MKTSWTINNLLSWNQSINQKKSRRVGVKSWALSEYKWTFSSKQSISSSSAMTASRDDKLFSEFGREKWPLNMWRLEGSVRDSDTWRPEIELWDTCSDDCDVLKVVMEDTEPWWREQCKVSSGEVKYFSNWFYLRNIISNLAWIQWG